MAQTRLDTIESRLTATEECCHDLRRDVDRILILLTNQGPPPPSKRGRKRGPVKIISND
jgi:hypothetical protein